MRKPYVALVLAVAMACGDDATDPMSSDGGATALDGSVGPYLPEPPATPADPAAPVIPPCADGWREVTDADGIPLCEPWPEAGMASCSGDELHLPGTVGCEPVGVACPSGPWPADLPAGRAVLYVRAGARGGDGSRGSPFGEVQDALDAASAGDVVALSTGTHDRFPVWEDAEIVGACAAGTRITPSSPTGTGVVVWSGAASLRDVTIGPVGDIAAAASGAGSSLSLRGTVLEDAVQVGVIADDRSTVDLERVVVRGTRIDARFGAGRGVLSQAGAALAIRSSVIIANETGALGALDGGTIDAEYSAAVEITNGRFENRAVNAVGNAVLSARWFVLENAAETGVTVGGDSTADFDGLVVRDTRGQADGTQGFGVVIQQGGTADMRRALVEGSHASAVAVGASFLDAPPATLRLTDAVIRDTVGLASDGSAGAGLVSQSGGDATLSRVLIARSWVAGVRSQFGGSTTLQDVVVLDTRPQRTNDNDGTGLSVGADSTMMAHRIVVERAGVGGVASYGGRLDARDVTVRDPTGLGDGRHGIGLLATEAGQLSAERVLVERAAESGLHAQGSSSLDLVDLTVRGTRGRMSDGAIGRGIQLQGGSSATIRRAHLTDQREYGVVVLSSPAPTTLNEVVVEQTVFSECTSCSERIGGSALVVTDAVVRVEGFAFRNSDQCGVHVAGRTLDLSRGSIVGAAIGACVQVEDFDVARLSDDVLYIDNGINLQATTLPVPEPVVVMSPER